MNPTTKRLAYFGIILAVILAVGIIGMILIEGLSLVDALYFSVVTVATVGYGDIHPLTPQGKILVIVLIVAGTGTFLGVVASATELLLERRQELSRRERLNMVIGLFYAEIGMELLGMLVHADPTIESFRSDFDVEIEWDEKRLALAADKAAKAKFDLRPDGLDLVRLRQFLRERSDLLLRILENPSLAEHGHFTELMRAVFHLKSELLSRKELSGLPQPDLEHLAGDARRAYRPLAVAWFHHLIYLRRNYPYLHSLAVRMNPFRTNPSPILT